MLEFKTMNSNIVNIDGLADALICSKDTLLKSWRQFPHFFVGQGDTAKGARFDAEDVIEYLKARDYYANLGQTDKKLCGQGAHYRASSKNSSRFSDKRRGTALGVERQKRSQKQYASSVAGDPFGILSGIK
jgi:hypothetical protein